MDTLTRLPPKKKVLETLLDKGQVFLHVDPTVAGVTVPGHLSARPVVVLQIGYDLAVPIPDLSLSDRGVTATLSFSRSPFRCTLPWGSVFAMVAETGEVMLWPSDMPQNLLDTTDRKSGADGSAARRNMRLIQGGLSDRQEPSGDRPHAGRPGCIKGRKPPCDVLSDPTPPRKPPHIRLVN